MARDRIRYALLLLAFAALYVMLVNRLSALLLLIVLTLPFLSLVLGVLLRWAVTIETSMLVPLGRTISPGQDFTVRVRCRNRTRIIPARLRFELSLSQKQAAAQELRRLNVTVTGTDPTTLELVAFSTIHGCLDCTVTRASVCDPLGLVRLPLRAAQRGRVVGSVLVQPEVVEPPEVENDGTMLVVPGDDPSELYDLRDYRPGDRITRIHRKLSDKFNRLIVKEYGRVIAPGAAGEPDHTTHTGVLEATPLRLVEPTRQSAFSWLADFAYYTVLLTLALTGGFTAFTSVFDLPVYGWALVVLTAGLALAAIGFFVRPRRPAAPLKRLLVVLAVTAVFLLIGFYFRATLLPYLAQGARLFINTLFSTYNHRWDFGFALLPTTAQSPAAVGLTLSVFLGVALVPFTILLTWALIRRHSFWLCFILTALLPAPALLYSLIPSYRALFLLGLFWLFLLLFLPPRTHVGRVRPDPYPASLLLLIPLAACLLLAAVLIPSAQTGRITTANNLRALVVSGRLNRLMVPINGLAGATNRVNLATVGKLAYTDRIVLKVKSNKKSPDYLKGFVGSVYTGSSWELLRAADRTALDALIQTYQPQNYPALLLNPPPDIEYSQQPYEVEVEGIETNPQMVYVPYGLFPDGSVDGLPSESNGLSGMNFVEGAFLRNADPMGRARSHVFALPLPTSVVEELSEAEGERTEEQESVLFAMERYQEFAQETYTRLPQGLRATLEQYCAERGLDPEDFDTLEEFVSACVATLQDENAYARLPGMTPARADFVEYFLLENHQGYCIHFASALTTMLRSAGIPARYVEGYVVRPDDAHDAQGWVSLPDRRAHAWTEVYVDKVGWIPVEATPAQAGVIDNPQAAGALTGDLVRGIDEPLVPIEQTPPPRPGGSGAVAGATPGTGASEGATTSVVTKITTGTVERKPTLHIRVLTRAECAGTTAVCVVLAVGAAVVARPLRLRRRYTRMDQPDSNQAALAAYVYALDLLAFARRTGRTEVEAAIPEDLQALALRARYSQHRLSAEQVTKLRTYAQALARATRKNTPVLRWLFGAYIRALF
jgi:hypothetical protein